MGLHKKKLRANKFTAQHKKFISRKSIFFYLKAASDVYQRDLSAICSGPCENLMEIAENFSYCLLIYNINLKCLKKTCDLIVLRVICHF